MKILLFFFFIINISNSKIKNKKNLILNIFLRFKNNNFYNSIQGKNNSQKLNFI